MVAKDHSGSWNSQRSRISREWPVTRDRPGSRDNQRSRISRKWPVTWDHSGSRDKPEEWKDHCNGRIFTANGRITAMEGSSLHPGITRSSW